MEGETDSKMKSCHVGEFDLKGKTEKYALKSCDTRSQFFGQNLNIIKIFELNIDF